MKMKRIVSFALALCLLMVCLPLSASAASSEANAAAKELYVLGLFAGTGNDADGNPVFELDRTPTRAEGVAMLVRLLGKEEEARAGTWTTPFTDVPNWAKPYVGYAYANQLTYGTGDTTFGSGDTITAPQYITFILRALNYEDGVDFTWRNAAAMSDNLHLSSGQYSAASAFTRGDIAILSRNALDQLPKGSQFTLRQILGKGSVIEEFVAMEETQAAFQEIIKAMGTDMLDVKISGEGNKFIYTATFTELSENDVSAMKDYLAEALNSEDMIAVYGVIASSLKEDLGAADPVVVVRYLGPDGAVLASREYHAA